MNIPSISLKSIQDAITFGSGKQIFTLGGKDAGGGLVVGLRKEAPSAADNRQVREAVLQSFIGLKDVDRSLPGLKKVARTEGNSVIISEFLTGGKNADAPLTVEEVRALLTCLRALDAHASGQTSFYEPKWESDGFNNPNFDSDKVLKPIASAPSNKMSTFKAPRVKKPVPPRKKRSEEIPAQVPAKSPEQIHEEHKVEQKQEKFVAAVIAKKKAKKNKHV